MFDTLSERFNDVFRKVRGRGRISEDNVREVMRDVRTALLEADVHLDVVKAFTREVAQRIEIREDRFGVEPELIAKVARMRLESEGGFRLVRIFETPVSYAGRTYAEGKKIGWRDGVWAVWCIVRYNLLR